MKRFAITFMTLALMASLAPSFAQDEKANVIAPNLVNSTPETPHQARLWNLQDADILSVINEVSLETGKNFVVDPRVTGKISLISSKPIKPDQVYQVFLSVLELLGYSAIPGDNIIKIVPNMESGEYATRIATNHAPGRGDEVVVRIIPLDNVSANQLIPVIRPMLPQWSNVAAYTPGNVIILLGRATNIERIANIIHNIDQTASNDIDVIPLHQATASQLVTVLNNLQSSARASGDTPQISIAADERSNSILLSGNKSARLHMKFLVSHLDTPSSSTLGNTQVIYLRYLQARNFAPLLGKIAQNMMGKNNNTPDNTTTSSNTNSTATATSGKSDKPPENLTNIQAEPNANAIIITAPPTLMQALVGIVAKLDIRPAQVLVEGIIVEVDQADLRNLGIQWGTLGPGTTDMQNPNVPSSTSSFPIPGAGNIGIIPHTNIAAILSFLENITGTDILSTPSIAVLDNQKAILEIGQDVPFQNGSYATTGSNSTVQPFNTIVQKPVTLKLMVIPQINLGNAVRLNINLKNDSLQNPDTPGLTPIINTSNIQNSVIINSEDVLVLGGLISNSITEVTNKVPLLGDIPVFGKLFQQKNRNISKKNLLVFIKPTIVRNAEDAANVTNTKYEAIRNTEINWPENLLKNTPSKAPIVAPLLKNDPNLPKPFANDDT